MAGAKNSHDGIKRMITISRDKIIGNRPVIISLLTVLILLVYWPVINFRFLTYDDGINIYNNWWVTECSLTNSPYFCQQSFDNLYSPITYNVWNLLAGLSQLLSPGAIATPLAGLYHAANLLIHLASCWLFFSILRAMGMRDRAALSGAAIFGIHPGQVEAVDLLQKAITTGARRPLLFTNLAWTYTALDKGNEATEARSRAKQL